jgi:hypothetical protein
VGDGGGDVTGWSRPGGTQVNRFHFNMMRMFGGKSKTGFIIRSHTDGWTWHGLHGVPHDPEQHS